MNHFESQYSHLNAKYMGTWKDNAVNFSIRRIRDITNFKQVTSAGVSCFLCIYSATYDATSDYELMVTRMMLILFNVQINLVFGGQDILSLIAMHDYNACACISQALISARHIKTFRRNQLPFVYIQFATFITHKPSYYCIVCKNRTSQRYLHDSNQNYLCHDSNAQSTTIALLYALVSQNNSQ